MQEKSGPKTADNSPGEPALGSFGVPSDVNSIAVGFRQTWPDVRGTGVLFGACAAAEPKVTGAGVGAGYFTDQPSSSRG